MRVLKVVNDILSKMVYTCALHNDFTFGDALRVDALPIDSTFGVRGTR